MTSTNNFTSLDEAFKWVVQNTLEAGENIAPRTASTTELRAVSFSISDPRRRYISLPPRRWSLAYAIGEFCWHARGSNLLDEIAFYAQRWRGMSDDAKTIKESCYGHTIFSKRDGYPSQWETISETLKLDLASRRAILTFNKPVSSGSALNLDISCATTMQFLVRNGRLDAVATMRSNDAILGMPYDVFLFTMLQEWMATILGLTLGHYHHFVGSMHIYDSDLAKARAIIETEPQIVEPMPAMSTVDGLESLLNGEIQTRLGAKPFTEKTGYWTELLTVLQYRNANIFEGSPKIRDIIANPLYLRLVQIRSSGSTMQEIGRPRG